MLPHCSVSLIYHCAPSLYRLQINNDLALTRLTLKNLHNADDKDDKADMRVLLELENIDDECDAHGIVFVKIDDDNEAKEYGFEELPVLVYFENKVPSIYEGDLNNEEQVKEIMSRRFYREIEITSVSAFI